MQTLRSYLYGTNEKDQMLAAGTEGRRQPWFGDGSVPETRVNAGLVAHAVSSMDSGQVRWAQDRAGSRGEIRPYGSQWQWGATNDLERGAASVGDGVAAGENR